MKLSDKSQMYIQNVLALRSCLPKETIFSIIAHCACHFQDTVKLLCLELGVSRSGYYKWVKRQTVINRHAPIVDAIRKYQAFSNCTTGYRKMAIYLKLNHITSLHASSIYRLMRKYGLLSHSIRTKKARLINRAIKPYRNLLNRDFSANRPNEKWCIDITQLNASNGKFYLCAIIDLFDRSVVSYHTSLKQNKALVSQTIKDAFLKVPYFGKGSLLLHSDQGAVFATREQKRLLRIYDIIPSMSRPGTPCDNAVIESFFSSLKCECIHILPRVTIKQMKSEIDKYITFYNHYRIHMKFRDIPCHVCKLGE